MTCASTRLLLAAALSCSVAGLRRTVRKHGAGKGTFHLRVLKNGTDCEVLDAEWGQVHRLALNDVYVPESKWQWSDEEDMHSQEEIQDLWGPEEGLVRSRARSICSGSLTEPVRPQDVAPANTEVRCLYCSGDSNNRIDVVLMGDGYREKERDRMFEDMERLKDEMFADVTFNSWLPVFNIWAIHVPSQDSGIGYGGRSKNTPFGLYKNGQQHRGVFPTSAGRSAARSVCQLADGCDFPSIIGNDEFYGGLGGEFTIGTRSRTTGTVVLRHEMGHNFVSVGEEYDNGQVYSGVNADTATWGGEPQQNIKWKHWLTNPDQPVREERMRLALAQYPWQDLASGRQSFTFNSDGSYASWKLSFTVSGIPEEGALRVTLDGEELDWTPTRPPGAERPDGSTADRQFYHFRDNARGFASGSHTLTFESAFPPASDDEPIRQLCSISIYEYDAAPSFNNTFGFVGAFPTFDTRGRKTYRPTNEMCLMRDMESRVFCPICKEGMWMQFLQRMTLLDDVEVTGTAENTQVQLKAVPLAQLRDQPVAGLTERYSVVWKKDGSEQSQLADQFSFSGAASELSGNWEVTLLYTTEEVRKDDDNLLTSSKTFSIGSGGGPSPTPSPPTNCPWYCSIICSSDCGTGCC